MVGPSGKVSPSVEYPQPAAHLSGGYSSLCQLRLQLTMYHLAGYVATTMRNGRSEPADKAYVTSVTIGYSNRSVHKFSSHGEYLCAEQ